MKTLFTNAARRRGVLYATAGVAALAFASPVLAQDSDEGEEEFPTTPIPDTTAPAAGDVITVTGSRIRRPEIVGTEPTTSISDDYYEDRNITSTADAINDLIVEQVKGLGAASVSITHDMPSARKIGDEIAMLYDGKIIWRGPASDVDDSGNEYVDQFVHGRADGPIQPAI